MSLHIEIAGSAGTEAKVSTLETPTRDPIKEAIAKLEDLSLGEVDAFDSYESLEAGCLSCSGVKVER